MKLLLDQNIRIETLDFLRNLNLDVISTREIKLERAEDAEILVVAKKLGRIIVTFNFDFPDIRHFHIWCDEDGYECGLSEWIFDSNTINLLSIRQIF